MRYIKIVPKMRIFGKDLKGNSQWQTTPDILAYICRFGKVMNTGYNVIDTAKIVEACEEAKNKKKRYIEIEDNHYMMLSEDLKTISFGDIGITGIAIVEDVKNIKNAPEQKPDDIDTPIEMEWPLSSESGINPESYPEEGKEFLKKKGKYVVITSGGNNSGKIRDVPKQQSLVRWDS